MAIMARTGAAMPGRLVRRMAISMAATKAKIAIQIMNPEAPHRSYCLSSRQSLTARDQGGVKVEALSEFVVKKELLRQRQSSPFRWRTGGRRKYPRYARRPGASPAIGKRLSPTLRLPTQQWRGRAP